MLRSDSSEKAASPRISERNLQRMTPFEKNYLTIKDIPDNIKSIITIFLNVFSLTLL